MVVLTSNLGPTRESRVRITDQYQRMPRQQPVTAPSLPHLQPPSRAHLEPPAARFDACPRPCLPQRCHTRAVVANSLARASSYSIAFACSHWAGFVHFHTIHTHSHTVWLAFGVTPG